MERRIGLAIAWAVVCGLTLGTPATACNGPQPHANMGAAQAPDMAALARLGMLQPRAEPGDHQGDHQQDTQAGADSDTPGIVGLWQVNYLAGGHVVDQGFEAWHSDGTEILVDIAPPATDNVCIGTWIKTGQTYKLTHPSWTFDITGKLTGTAMIRNTVTLDHGGDKFTGTFTVDIFDTKGKLQQHFDGQLAATRISPN